MFLPLNKRFFSKCQRHKLKIKIIFFYLCIAVFSLNRFLLLQNHFTLIVCISFLLWFTRSNKVFICKCRFYLSVQWFKLFSVWNLFRVSPPPKQNNGRSLVFSTCSIPFPSSRGWECITVKSCFMSNTCVPHPLTMVDLQSSYKLHIYAEKLDNID